MAVTPRFECASSSLALKRLLKKTKPVLWASFVVGIAAHLWLTEIRGVTSEQGVVKPLTTQFIKRKPRLSKPLELKRTPRPRQRLLKRRMVSTQAKAHRTHRSEISGAGYCTDHMAAQPLGTHRQVPFVHARSEPEALAESIRSSRAAKSSVDMSLELMDISALDTGQYQAMVIQDRNDRRGVRGFLHLGEAYPQSVLVAMSADRRQLPGAAAIRALVEAMNEYTLIRTDVTMSYTFDSEELLKTPFILTVATKLSRIRYTPCEVVNMGRYFLEGGFVVADVRGPGLGPRRPGAISMRSFIVAALNTLSIPYQTFWDFEKLPESHPLYHSFFDFPDGPPGAVDVLQGRGPVPYLEGVQIDNRLVTVLSMKALAAAWGQDKHSAYKYTNNTRHLQFGVNIIVFALTQEGSITHRLMESVAY